VEAEIALNLRRAKQGDKMNFWAAIDKNGQVLGVGSHQEAISLAIKSGVENPIVWRVVESYEHEEKGIKVVSGKDGGLSIELVQTCPKCKVKMAAISPRCNKCGYIVFPNLA
jgi:hypothetical protein